MILVKMKTTGAVPKVAMKIMNKAKKLTWRDAGVQWHRHMRPLHFQAGADVRYDHSPRTATYEWRKRRAHGHVRDLEWSGLSKSLTRQQDIRATSKGVRVVMNAPALNLKPKSNPNNIDMRAELTKILPSEASAIAKNIDSNLGRRLNQDRTRVIEESRAAFGK